MAAAVQCLKEHVVANEENLCFFKRNEHLHLIVKPELRCYVETARLILYRESKKKVRVRCKECNSDVGCEVPYGPQGIRFLAFANDKILFYGEHLRSTETWSRIAHRYTLIQIRTEENFQQDFSEGTTISCNSNGMNENQPIQWPETEAEFKFDDLDLSKVPRKYQVEVYLEALQRDLVAVLPTGAGKTFIATMLLAKLRLLNPSRLGLFIVKTIPLVFQQAESINADCGLKVCPLCGENNTSAKLRALTNGKFEILVVTAGALKELLRSDKLNFNMFYCFVIDEVHHVGYNSDDYTHLVQMWSTSNVPKQRPRLLGLTASPFKVSTYHIGMRNLKFFRSQLQNAVIFKPIIAQSQPNTKWQLVTITDEQDQFFNEIVSLCNLINIEMKLDLLITNDIVKHYSSKLKGEISKLELRESLGNRSCSMLKILLAVIEVSHCISIEEAVRSLTALHETPGEVTNSAIRRTITGIEKKFSKSSEPSPRLKALYNVLETKDPQTSYGVIFVETRNTARVLCDTLKRTKSEWFPKLFVGRGGIDGMRWRDDQEIRMEEFREGQTHLLIATSVLEEGMDVAECDLVVRFSPVRSLISYVQSRGRARKINAEFVLIVSEEERQNSLKVVKNEKLLNDVLSNHAIEAQLPSKHTQQLMNKFSGDHFDNDWIFYSNMTKMSFDEISMEMYFEAFQGNDIDMKLSLIDSIEESCKVKVKHVDIERHSASIRCGAPDVFPISDTTALLSVKSKDSSCPFETIWKTVLYEWDFKIQSESTALSTFVRFPKIPDVLITGKTTDFIVNVSIGKFIDKNQYKKVQHIGEGIMWFEEQKISIQINFYTLDILRESIAPFMYVSFDSNLKRYLLFMPLTSLPISGWWLLFNKFDRTNYCCSTPLSSISDYPVLLLEVESQELSFLNILETLEGCGIPILFCDMAVVEEDAFDWISSFTSSCSEEIDETEFLCWWYLAVINSEMKLFLPDKLLQSMYASMKNYAEQKNSFKMKQMTFLLQQLFYESKFFPYWSSIEERYCQLKTEVELLDNTVSMNIPASHCVMKRLVVTPGRRIFKPEALYPHSRITRQFMDKVDFLIVSFKDEQEQRIADISMIYKRFSFFLSDGINIFNRKYLFLCASASQVRTQRSYFVWIKSGNMSIEDIRNEIICNSRDYYSPGKYFSRLSLFCTADRQTISLQSNEIHEIKDLYAKNGDMVTDGAGKISEKCAEEMTRHLNLEEVPSAFQIRYAGIKGVIVKVNPLTDEDFLQINNRQIQLLYRPSMLKFVNKSTELNVVSYSRFLELHLNHEIILLLLALHLQDEDSDFINTLLSMHTDYIKKLGKCFTDEHIAKDLLVQYFPRQFISFILESGIDIFTDSYWFSIISGIYSLCFKNLTDKTRIPVKDGCLLLGIPDPLGVLKDGEVFLCINDPKNKNESYSVISGRVVVYRNPCLHPGDARIVTAVDIQELHYFRNCLIFPAENPSVSLASECSGGDLDGDLYGCIFDEKLVPKCNSYQPLEYSNLAKRFGQSKSSTETMVGFFCKVMSNDVLGRICTMHLSLSVMTKEGVLHSLALKLAESQAIAVDFPKTGVMPRVPKDTLKLVGTKHPDFIERPKGYRKSFMFFTENPLGVMFRECKSYDFEQRVRKSKFEAENRLLVAGNDRFFDEALLIYKLYEADMKRALLACDLDTEGDLIIGRPINWNEAHLGDKMKAMKLICACRESLKNRYRAIFLDDPKVISHKDSLAKASAWHRVVFEKQTIEKVFHSFVWLIIPEELCMLRCFIDDGAPTQTISDTLFMDIGASLNQYFKNQVSSIRINQSRKSALFAQIREAVNQRDLLRLWMFGSSSIFVCEDYSDLDVYAEVLLPAFKNKELVLNEEEFRLLSQSVQEKHFLQMLIWQNIGKVANSKEEIFHDEIPLIRCKMPSGEELEEVTVNISMNPDGWLKVLHIQSFYALDVIVFPCFYYLIQWARVSGIIKTASADTEHLLSTDSFYALVLNIFERILDDSSDDVQPLDDVDTLVSQSLDLNDEETKRLGNLTIKFFEIGASMAEEVVYIWKVCKTPSHIISKIPRKLVKQFSFCCSRTLTILGIHRSVESVFTQLDSHQTKWCFPLSAVLVNDIGNAKSFHQDLLRFKSGANVQLISKQENARILLLKAEGSVASIDQLRKELTHLSNTSCALSRRPRRVPKSFIEGSSVFLLKNLPIENDVQIGFRNSFGPFNLMHSLKLRSNPVHVGKDDFPLLNSQWVDQVAKKLNDCLQEQLDLFCQDQRNLLLVDTMEMSLRFGNFYAVDVERCLAEHNKTLTLLEFSDAMETYFATPRKEIDMKLKKFGGKMIYLLTSGSHAPKNREVVLSRNRFKRKNGIPSSFCPGLLANNCVDPSVIETCKSLYRKVLEKYGFSESSDSGGWWRVNFHPTVNHELSLVAKDDVAKTFVKFVHRSKVWLSVTICDPRQDDVAETSNITKSHDMRLKLVTTEDVSAESDVYKFCFSEGGQFPLKIDARGEPSIGHLPTPLQSSIGYIRHVMECICFSSDDVNAELIMGKEYNGRQMKLYRGFVELNFYFNISEIKRQLKRNRFGNINISKSFMQNVINKTMEISNLLNEEIKNLPLDSMQ